MRKRTRKTVKKYSHKERTEQLQSFVQLCYLSLGEKTNWDLKEICNLTGLSMGTARKYLDTERVTLKMHVQTLQKLSVAAGYNLTLTESTIKMRVVD